MSHAYDNNKIKNKINVGKKIKVVNLMSFDNPFAINYFLAFGNISLIVVFNLVLVLRNGKLEISHASVTSILYTRA